MIPRTTPPPENLLRLRLLDRCSRLGAPAAAIGAQGHVMGVSTCPPAAEAIMRSARIVAAINVCSIRGVGEVANYEIFPGARLVVVPHADGPEGQGRVGALLLTPEAVEHPEFAVLCTQAGQEPATARDAVRGLARFDSYSADLFKEALLSSSVDLAALDEHHGALDGFTRQLSESYDTIDLLYSLGRSMPKPYEPEKFLATVVQRLHAVMNFRWLAIVTGASGPSVALQGRVISAGTCPVSNSDLRRTVEANAPTEDTPQVRSDLPPLVSADSPQTLLQAIRCKGKLLGVIVAGGKHGDDPMVSSYDLQLVEATAGYLSAFADNVALYEDQKNLFLGTLHALTAAIDAKDRYTCGHSERVAMIARTIAREAGLSDAEAERIHIAGLVHDVGKIGVPEAVLCKPGKLTDAEFGIIKLHPEIGHRILKDISQLSDVLPGVLHHHERWDGRGYPHGLAGDRIPICARILAVADTFDAMSSTRSYRPALERPRVMEEIAKSAGTQLDPTFASILRRISLREFDGMLAQHKAMAALPAA